MNCSCLSVLLVYATRRTANCVALAILIGTCQLVNDIRARRGNACVRTCKTKTKIESKLKRNEKESVNVKRKLKPKIKLYLKLKKHLSYSGRAPRSSKPDASWVVYVRHNRSIVPSVKWSASYMSSANRNITVIIISGIATAWGTVLASEGWREAAGQPSWKVSRSI